MKKCDTCGSYIITQEDIEGLRKSSYGHPDPVGEPGAPGVDGVHDVILESRRLGHWIFKKYVGEDYYRCSCCGQEYPFPADWCEYDIHEYLNYCSNCGAKMREITDEEV